MFRYVHTNIIAKDVNKLIVFYKNVFHCKSINEARNLSGEWLDKLTGLKQAHIVGEHLLLPGYGEEHPTLEIFSYDTLKETELSEVNRSGFAHIAFEVDDVEALLTEIIKWGGSKVGEMITTAYPNNLEASFVYARDPEGNIIELQCWKKNIKIMIQITNENLIFYLDNVLLWCYNFTVSGIRASLTMPKVVI